MVRTSVFTSVDKTMISKPDIDANSAGGVTHYLPHHAVINPTKTTTKLHVVYDASSKARHSYQSLNDCLFRGPVMLY